MIKIGDLIILEWTEYGLAQLIPMWGGTKSPKEEKEEKVVARAFGCVIEEDDKQIVILVYSSGDERLFFNVPRLYITSIKILEEKQ